MKDSIEYRDNSFQDFKNSNKTWTIELCNLDSDGDGKTNGEELGDPSCVWTPGKEPKVPAKNHPGTNIFYTAIFFNFFFEHMV